MRSDSYYQLKTVYTYSTESDSYLQMTSTSSSEKCQPLSTDKWHKYPFKHVHTYTHTHTPQI